MTTRNTRDLVDDVLRNKLRVLADGEEATTGDYQTVSNKYADIYAELAEDGVAYWAENEIPVAVFDRLSEYLGSRIGSAFGYEASPPQRQWLLLQLKKHTARQHSKQPTPVEYF